MRARARPGRLLLPAVAAVLLGTLLLSPRSSSASPHFVLVFRLASPHASAARALSLGRMLGLEGTAVRESRSSFVVGDPTGKRSLVLFKASGGFDFVDRAIYGQAPAGQLPSAQQARGSVLEFLRMHGLLPAEDLSVDVRADSLSRPTAQVVTLTPLAAGAPVRDGTITFWLGRGSSIERLRDEHRALSTTAIRVVGRPRGQVLREIRDDLGPTSGIRLRLAYVAQPPYIAQPYLEPVLEAVAHGSVVDRVRATTFTPRATVLSPKPGDPIVAGVPVRLRARGAEGRRPYRFRWYANASGFLGTGKARKVRLRPDDTEIRLVIRDSSGAGSTYSLPVWVVGARTAGPAATQAESTLADGPITFAAQQDATHPLLFRDVDVSGTERATVIRFDQLRYSTAVRFQGADYHVTSGRCVPRIAPGDACTLPKGPYAQSTGASAPAVSDRGSTVDSTLTLDSLPGQLKLLVEGSAAPFYCGPRGELGSVALELLPKLVFGAGTVLGGDCPGFRPSVEWSYRPPASFRASDLARLCLQSARLCDIPQPLLTEWATGKLDQGPQPEIADFRLSVYTLVEPGAGPARAALASDGATTRAPGASDGPLDPSCAAPSPCISPIASERAGTLTLPTGRGEWDELYLKSEAPEPQAIAFPYCNRAPDERDVPSCIHLRERSRGQEVTVFTVRARAGEASPESVESLADGEPLRQDAGHGYGVVVWHRSTASSTQCYPAGGVDNTERPCRAFWTPLFFSPN